MLRCYGTSSEYFQIKDYDIRTKLMFVCNYREQAVQIKAERKKQEEIEKQKQKDKYEKANSEDPNHLVTVIISIIIVIGSITVYHFKCRYEREEQSSNLDPEFINSSPEARKERVILSIMLSLKQVMYAEYKEQF